MSNTKDFLIEIGTEELPPKLLNKLSQAFCDHVTKGIEQANLNFSEINAFAAPRRLALLIKNLNTKQADQQIERRGPAVDKAFDTDGKPTKACLGFAKSCGVAVSDLKTLTTDKGEWLSFSEHQKGQATTTLMPEIITKTLTQLPITRAMRWGNYETEFVRPVQWLVMLFGKDVVPATVLGKTADRNSYGHRFHHPKAISLKTAPDYETALEAAFVIPSFAKRRATIEQQIIAATPKGATTIIEPDLLDEVTGIVEWPVALLAEFDQAFLTVPPEALISAMHTHQKCFHLEDANGQMLANFILISNLESKDPEQVVFGNQRVMRARLADAAFFYNTDLKTRLENHLATLKTVTFQAKLGSLFEKAKRLSHLATFIAKKVKVNTSEAARAGLLAKCDLMTNMVGEFPELQGIMGSYYAEHDQESGAVAVALKEQYLPRFAGDELPTTALGAALALAERLDTLIGIFGIGQAPRKDKDPFALRRAAQGVVRIIIEKQFSFNLSELLQAAIESYTFVLPNKETLSQVQQFILERMRAWYLEQNTSPDVFAAVLARTSDNLYDFDRRITAVAQFRELAAAKALAAANKRVSKILIKEQQEHLNNGVDKNLLEQTAEKELATLIKDKTNEIAPLYQQGDYTQALTILASLQPPIDRFFDEVMVMVGDEKLRKNRLALLGNLRKLFLQVADISLLHSS